MFLEVMQCSWRLCSCSWRLFNVPEGYSMFLEVIQSRVGIELLGQLKIFDADFLTYWDLFFDNILKSKYQHFLNKRIANLRITHGEGHGVDNVIIELSCLNAQFFPVPAIILIKCLKVSSFKIHNLGPNFKVLVISQFLTVILTRGMRAAKKEH